MAGIDLGMTNIATVAFPDQYVLYPGNSLKEEEDKHYVTRAELSTTLRERTTRQSGRCGRVGNSPSPTVRHSTTTTTR
ncbi:transposase [Haloquadratum walsbyi]|uniref:transposase n=1 Tax=Haloquadratum walsbyi TaxID=293091 RepID=UPI00373FE36A